MKKIFFYFFLTSITPSIVWAQGIENKISANNINELIRNIISAALGVIGAVALIMFVYGGFLWLTAAGNKNTIEKGKETMIWASLGLVLIFASYILVQFLIEAVKG